MEYSQEKDAPFCYACRHFSLPAYENPEDSWTLCGLRSWKHARGKNGKITTHKLSKCHVMVMPAWADYEKNNSENTSVTQMISENYQKEG